MTEIDDITQQLTRSAGRALQAARAALERSRQRSSREREEVRREREHRLRMFEEQLRTTVLQRRLAVRGGNQEIADDLTEIEQQQRTQELISRWAAAEAQRANDSGLADAWTARLREAGIDPEAARTYAAEPGSGSHDPDYLIDSEQMAVDYAGMTADLADTRAAAQGGNDAAATDEGTEAARLINIAHPQPHRIGPVKPAPIPIDLPGQALDLEHVSQL